MRRRRATRGWPTCCEAGGSSPSPTLPDRWFGYDAVDVVILATGKLEFVHGLLADEPRRKALQEWVQRGGQLVLTVGRNQQDVARLLKAMPVVRVEFSDEGVKQAAELTALSRWLPGNHDPL